MKNLATKSSVNEIRIRFDHDVERFSNLETGQTATIDAPLAMELITQAAISSTPIIHRLLDLGCGAGNNTLKLLQSYQQPIMIDLLDLSTPMLERAKQRVKSCPQKEMVTEIRTHATDFRDWQCPDESFDVILAAAVLHHLRDDQDWLSAFQKLYRILKPGGSVWITDLVIHEIPTVDQLMWQRYGEYLTELQDAAYRDKVFAYIKKEDTPRSLTYQLRLLEQVGFRQVEVLHKNSCFAAFGALK